MLIEIANYWFDLSMNLNLFNVIIIDLLYVSIIRRFLNYTRLFPLTLEQKLELKQRYLDFKTGTIIIAAILEEILFRLPLLFLIIFCKDNEYLNLILLSASVILSVIFGIAHGNISNILRQGIPCFIYCSFIIVSYYKYGFILAFLNVCIAHFLFNYMIIKINTWKKIV